MWIELNWITTRNTVIDLQIRAKREIILVGRVLRISGRTLVNPVNSKRENIEGLVIGAQALAA
jgi:hypothetical protein